MEDPGALVKQKSGSFKPDICNRECSPKFLMLMRESGIIFESADWLALMSVWKIFPPESAQMMHKGKKNVCRSILGKPANHCQSIGHVFFQCMWQKKGVGFGKVRILETGSGFFSMLPWKDCFLQQGSFLKSTHVDRFAFYNGQIVGKLYLILNANPWRRHAHCLADK